MELYFVQVCLDFVEFVLTASVVLQFRHGLDFRVLPLALVVAGAGEVLPRAYPLGDPTYFSIGVQLAAVIILLALSRPASVFRSGGLGRRRWI
jgi:hypothetical protein